MKFTSRVFINYLRRIIYMKYIYIKIDINIKNDVIDLKKYVLVYLLQL